MGKISGDGRRVAALVVNTAQNPIVQLESTKELGPGRSYGTKMNMITPILTSIKNKEKGIRRVYDDKVFLKA